MYSYPVNFDKLILFQNEVHFLPFSTISSHVYLTTCKRFFLDFFTSLLYALFEMPALFECLLILTSVINLQNEKCALNVKNVC